MKSFNLLGTFIVLLLLSFLSLELMLISNFKLKLQDMKRLKEKKSVKFNVDLLKNENVRKKYTDSIDVKLNGKRVGNIETDWSKISQVIKNSGTKHWWNAKRKQE